LEASQISRTIFNFMESCPFHSLHHGCWMEYTMLKSAHFECSLVTDLLRIHMMHETQLIMPLVNLVAVS